MKTPIFATLMTLVIMASLLNGADGSILLYGLCQTACNAAWVSCYAAAGLVAGAATGGLGIPAAAIACNIGQGVCMASCAASFLVPFP
ncbi:cysteine-rich protein [Jimgerdemannia flammicorona]|uniref:Cysteine-rich protein n=2 Tax=Jimgerdemannia flammicorona TaxID=994334 RepID=A0A433QBQ5_9FUNG|nr:cysteine-rich protein [Jimgerdemannia flammicorona]RUS27191.1 cysteine-rich protein [Jimgerdemannia flammicorona]